MTVDDTLLNRLEKLSSLKVSEDSRENIKSSMSDILEFVDNLKTIDVSNISATANTLDGGTTMQEDTPRDAHDIAEDILKHSPSHEGTFFLVPKIIE
jgi:aspartyl-tRNA(Asn)/glutamyl-tRNA(Gln) amidotransferase subunit C